MKNEIWKDVEVRKGHYQISNLGRLRSLDRTILFSNGSERFYKGKIIEGGMVNGYRQTAFRINGIGRTYKFSQLVAMAFLNHIPDGNNLVVDHINGVKDDDRLVNLRIVTNRSNTSTCFRSNEDSFSSKYVGVSWSNENLRWVAKISYNGTSIHLGYFDNEIEASNVYQSALKRIKEL